MNWCENPLCENPAHKAVPVSVSRAGDQKRTLCAACEEVYTWGVQHGRMAAEGAAEGGARDRSDTCASDGLPSLARLLDRPDFVVLGENRTNPSPGMPVEAWAYEGPLDFAQACPITFGLGRDCQEALAALGARLAEINDGSAGQSGR